MDLIGDREAAPGATPSAAAMRARFAATASGSSREPTPPLSEA